MSLLGYVGAALIVLVNLLLIAWLVGRLWLRWRGTRIVTCPDNEQPAVVEVDASRAARAALRGRTTVTLKECSRWPEKAGCGQACLRQIESAPADCLLRTIITGWYGGKKCVLCARPFGVIHWHDHQPALIGPSGGIVEWSDVAPERTHETMESHRPICWSCKVAEELRAKHPARVTDRV